jgi:hypothetical protein
MAYIDKHTERLKGFGIVAAIVKLFDINEGLTRVTKGPQTSSPLAQRRSTGRHGLLNRPFGL